jgi:hypothetical protein
MSAPIPFIGDPKIGNDEFAFAEAFLRAFPAAINMLRSDVSAAICGTAASEKLSVSVA